MSDNRKLSPWDVDLIAMIEAAAQTECKATLGKDRLILSVSRAGEWINKPHAIEALNGAVRGRMGNRYIQTKIDKDNVEFELNYDSECYPIEIKSPIRQPDVSGGLICVLKEKKIRAVVVNKDDFENVAEFTGGGSMTIGDDGNLIKYSFVNEKGNWVDVPNGGIIFVDDQNRFNWTSKKIFDTLYNVSCENEGFEKAGNEQDYEERLVGLYNEKFGTDVYLRFSKLIEEYNELQKELSDYVLNQENPEAGEMLKGRVLDELSDFLSVGVHLSHILGKNVLECLKMAYDKQIYRKDHPHEKKYSFADNFLREIMNCINCNLLSPDKVFLLMKVCEKFLHNKGGYSRAYANLENDRVYTNVYLVGDDRNPKSIKEYIENNNLSKGAYVICGASGKPICCYEKEYFESVFFPCIIPDKSVRDSGENE